MGGVVLAAGYARERLGHPGDEAVFQQRLGAGAEGFQCLLYVLFRVGGAGDTAVVGAGIATALAGTFFGIFGSYCMVAPLATNCDFNGHAEIIYMKVIKSWNSALCWRS